MFPANHTIRLTDIKTDPLIKNVLENYEIFDENYRPTLNNKILDHYAYEEIGLETPALFAHYLKVRLNEIMPKYNKLYESEILKFDPLSNYNMVENFENENNTESTGSTDSSNNTTTNSSSSATNNLTGNSSDSEIKKEVQQNTPQGRIAEQTIENYDYATTQVLSSDNNSNQHTSSSTSESSDNTSRNSTNNATNENNAHSTTAYVKKIVGNKGINYTTLFTQFVNSFVSIDKLIIDELSDLFMGIY